MAADFTGADFDIFALSAGVTFYPFNHIPLVLGAGLGSKYKNEHWKYYYRSVVAYDFHVGKFTLGPVIIHDFFPSSKDITSFGLGFGIGF